MKSLQESLLDDEDTLMDNSDKYIQIKDWLDKYEYSYGIKNYKINKDLTIDCDFIRIYNYLDFYEFPDFIQFNNVKKISIEGAQQMKSCKGFPKTCEHMFLSELFIHELDIPTIVTDALIITECPELKHIKTNIKQLHLLRLIKLNKLENLKDIVENKADVVNLNCIPKITSLKGLPNNIGDLHLSHCRNLYSSEGCPKHIKYIKTNYGIDEEFINAVKKINNIKN